MKNLFLLMLFFSALAARAAVIYLGPEESKALVYDIKSQTLVKLRIGDTFEGGTLKSFDDSSLKLDNHGSLNEISRMPVSEMFRQFQERITELKTSLEKYASLEVTLNSTLSRIRETEEEARNPKVFLDRVREFLEQQVGLEMALRNNFGLYPLQDSVSQKMSNLMSAYPDYFKFYQTVESKVSCKKTDFTPPEPIQLQVVDVPPGSITIDGRLNDPGWSCRRKIRKTGPFPGSELAACSDGVNLYLSLIWEQKENTGAYYEFYRLTDSGELMLSQLPEYFFPRLYADFNGREPGLVRADPGSGVFALDFFFAESAFFDQLARGDDASLDYWQYNPGRCRGMWLFDRSIFLNKFCTTGDFIPMTPENYYNIMIRQDESGNFLNLATISEIRKEPGRTFYDPYCLYGDVIGSEFNVEFRLCYYPSDPKIDLSEKVSAGIFPAGRYEIEISRPLIVSGKDLKNSFREDLDIRPGTLMFLNSLFDFGTDLKVKFARPYRLFFVSAGSVE
ncbi:MAG: hypothetical protein PHW04_07405 [Candidatus Wallbacteria bacterium]|nr:hypothetical protein [Candidatus Wallbacteria bacterium]